MTHTFQMLVDGRAESGVGSFDVINPATGTAFAQCPKADSRVGFAPDGTFGSVP